MEHYRALAETLGPRGGWPGGDEAIARLAPEVANLDAVIRRGLEGGESTRWIDAALALRDFARHSGHVTPSPLGPALAAATAARDIYRQARCTESLGEANCIERLGDIALERSEHEQARAMYEKALPLYRQVGSVLGEANCVQRLGDIARAQGDIRRARSCYEAALTLYARIPAPFSMGWTYRRLARLATDPASRRPHVAAARSAWLSIDRPDLVADLDREFP